MDRGFTYGDGLFETINIQGGIPPLWDWHWARLSQGCRRLGILIDHSRVLAYTRDLLNRVNRPDQAILKIIVTRGEGNRGYGYDPGQLPTVVAGLFSAANYPDSFQSKGVALYPCKQRLGLNPDLAGLKLLNKLEHVLARGEWQSDVYSEGLMLDIEGRVIEGNISNIFACCDGQMITPQLHRCGVAGVMRRLVMERLAPSIGLKVLECDILPEQIYDADELFLTNSVFGIWPVVHIGEVPIKRGAIVERLQRALATEIESTTPKAWQK